MRRQVWGVLVALGLLPVVATSARASTYGHLPKVGSWRGQTADHHPVSLRVTRRGRRVGSFILHVHYACTSGSTDQPVPGGDLVLRRGNPVPVEGSFGLFKPFYVNLAVPGVSRRAAFKVTGGFSSNKPTGPGTRASGAISGSFTKDNGDSCQLSRDGIIDWSARPHG